MQGFEMARAAEYWFYARECEHWATEVYDEQDRKVFWKWRRPGRNWR